MQQQVGKFLCEMRLIYDGGGRGISMLNAEAGLGKLKGWKICMYFFRLGAPPSPIKNKTKKFQVSGDPGLHSLILLPRGPIYNFLVRIAYGAHYQLSRENLLFYVEDIRLPPDYYSNT